MSQELYGDLRTFYSPFVDEDDTCYSVWRIVEVLKTEEIDMYHDGFTDSCITADVINKMLYGCC